VFRPSSRRFLDTGRTDFIAVKEDEAAHRWEAPAAFARPAVALRCVRQNPGTQTSALDAPCADPVCTRSLTTRHDPAPGGTGKRGRVRHRVVYPS
jgi:hypothetical protein